MAVGYRGILNRALSWLKTLGKSILAIYFAVDSLLRFINNFKFLYLVFVEYRSDALRVIRKAIHGLVDTDFPGAFGLSSTAISEWITCFHVKETVHELLLMAQKWFPTTSLIRNWGECRETILALLSISCFWWIRRTIHEIIQVRGDTNAMPRIQKALFTVQQAAKNLIALPGAHHYSLWMQGNLLLAGACFVVITAVAFSMLFVWILQQCVHEDDENNPFSCFLSSVQLAIYLLFTDYTPSFGRILVLSSVANEGAAYICHMGVKPSKWGLFHVYAVCVFFLCQTYADFMFPGVPESLEIVYTNLGQERGLNN